MASPTLRRAVVRHPTKGFFEHVDVDLDALLVGQLRAYGIDGVAIDASSSGGVPQRIVNVAAPSDPTDAVNRAYVDAVKQGIYWKDPVRVASTANVNLAAPGIIDTVTLAEGERALLKDQTNAAQNGLYVLAGGVLVRAPDGGAGQLRSGTLVPVQDGTANKDTMWWITAPDTAITVGTTAITWSQFKSAGDLVAGRAISIAGNQIAVTTGNGITGSGAIAVDFGNGHTQVPYGDHNHDSLYAAIGHVGSGGAAHALAIANGAAGFLSGADKAKLDGITGTGSYTLPVATATVLGGVKQGANVAIAGDGTISVAAPYVHPANHAPSIITQDTNNRFVTDAEKTTWSGKLDAAHAGTGGSAHALAIAGGAAGFMSGADKTKLDGIATGATANVGTVTSVGLALPADFTVTNSPVTGAGTLTAAWANVGAGNRFLASPNGASGAPSFRAIVAADIPTLNQNTTGTAANVTGTVAIGNGGTGQTTKVAAYDALSPNTTQGDFTYRGATNNVRLAGNTTAARQYLSMISSVPSWVAITAADVGAAPSGHVGSTNGHPDATALASGFMSATDKANLNTLVGGLATNLHAHEAAIFKVGVAGSNFAAGDPVAFDGSGYKLADAADPLLCDVIGVAVQATLSGADLYVANSGLLRGVTGAAGTCWMAVGGGRLISATAPGANGNHVYRLGYQTGAGMVVTLTDWGEI